MSSRLLDASSLDIAIGSGIDDSTTAAALRESTAARQSSSLLILCIQCTTASTPPSHEQRTLTGPHVISTNNSLLVLNLGLDIVDGIGRLDLEGDSLAREGLYEYLHDVSVLLVLMSVDLGGGEESLVRPALLLYAQFRPLCLNFALCNMAEVFLSWWRCSRCSPARRTLPVLAASLCVPLLAASLAQFQSRIGGQFAAVKVGRNSIAPRAE